MFRFLVNELPPLNFVLTPFCERPTVQEDMDQDNVPTRLGRAKPGARPANHRERIKSARQTAEALFAPKPRSDAPLRSPPVPTADQSVRSAGLSETSTMAPVPSTAVKVPTASPAIPAEDLPRIRTWMRYGMTVSEVARVYGVPIGQIKQLLRDGRSSSFSCLILTVD